jgi:hypothetical protein
MANSQSNWTPCPEGELVGLASALKTNRRLVTARRAAMCAAFGLVLVVGGYFGVKGVTGSPQDFGLRGGITCRDCAETYDDFVAGQLDKEMEARMSAHLDDCPSCKEHLEPNGRGSSQLDRPGQIQVSFASSSALTSLR